MRMASNATVFIMNEPKSRYLGRENKATRSTRSSIVRGKRLFVTQSLRIVREERSESRQHCRVDISRSCHHLYIATQQIIRHSGVAITDSRAGATHYRHDDPELQPGVHDLRRLGANVPPVQNAADDKAACAAKDKNRSIRSRNYGVWQT